MKAMLKTTAAIALALSLVACGGADEDDTGLSGFLSGAETPATVEGGELATEGGEAASGADLPGEGGEMAGMEGGETAGGETAGGEAAGEEGGEAAGEEGGEAAGEEGGEGTGEAGGTCFDILSCGQTCGDQNCILDCIASGSPQAQQEFTALNNCLATNCPNATTEAEAQQCVAEFCAAEAQQCIGGAGPGGTGGGQTGTDCQGTLICMQGCGENEACLEGCVAGGTPDAQEQLAALAQCGDTFCSEATEAEVEECLTTNCGAEINACFAGGGAGGGGAGGGEPCAEGLTFEGCCDGATLTWCENGATQSIPCELGCGNWDETAGYYDCFQDGQTEPVADPSGTFPVDCQ